jgi:hypothetical protein
MFEFYFAAATLFVSVEHPLTLIFVVPQFSKIILLGGILLKDPRYLTKSM